jgi:hypothetical protein
VGLHVHILTPKVPDTGRCHKELWVGAYELQAKIVSFKNKRYFTAPG